MQLSGQTIFVTGGASGLGLACVERFSAAGANVVVADRNVATGEEVAQCQKGRCLFVPLEITDAESAEAAFATAVKEFGTVQVVVHCAGILGAARLLGKNGLHDLGLFRRLIDVDLIGTFHVLRAAAAVMKDNPPNPEGERGVFIATSSVAAEDGQIGQAAYSAAKAGVSGMMLPLARELAHWGIRVVAIAPGVFETPMLTGGPEEVRNSLAEQVPFPLRLGRPAEYAQLAQQIIENSYLNGTTIRLDAALRMGPH